MVETCWLGSTWMEKAGSWGLMVSVSCTVFELGLATRPNYRSHGYATLAAVVCGEHSVGSGLTPHWHCDEKKSP